MNTFEITIQRRNRENWPVVVEQSTAGVFLPVRAEGILQAGMAEFQAQLNSQCTPREYGEFLGKALFCNDVRDAFVQAVGKCNLNNSDDRLHVLLFVEDTELRTLRWEQLCAPLDGDWQHLALNQRVPFSLYLPSVTDRRFQPIGRRDLRALVVVANPEGIDKYKLAPFDVAATVSSVRAALGEIPSDVLAMVDGACGPPTLDVLCERITAERYTLLHIVGHGQYIRGDGETILYLAKADNNVDPVPATRLLQRLKQLNGARGLPHFTFLSTCESAAPEAEGALGGLGQRLVRELGMPAVIAMTEMVSIKTAQNLAEAFYRRLREHGEVDLALVESCAGLVGRHDIVVPALYSRLGGRPLFSDTLERPLTDVEIAHGLKRMNELLPQRAPVLFKDFEALAAIVQGSFGADLNALGPTQREEHTKGLAGVQRICEESLDLSFTALALDHRSPVVDERCPFQGLLPFRYENREFFFGREVLIQCLERKLADHPFLAVLGPSGSGKSSVVLGGLIPSLQAKQADLAMAFLTPGTDPLGNLNTSLVELQGRPGIVVVDQFEELFTHCTDESKRQAFLNRLFQFPEKVKVIITMRADFWGECAPYSALKDCMQVHQELIPPMDATELRWAIESQASKVSLRFEADLSSTILDDVAGEPGAMPLLQHALLELWKRRHGRWLRAEEYRALGGVKMAIAETAEAVYRDLSADRECVREIFVRLTRLGEESLNTDERHDTRQRVRLDELTPVGGDIVATKALVKRLADSRLIVTNVNAATKHDEVEVAHEALIRYWPRLRGWLDEDQTDLRVLASIRLATQDWQKDRTDESLLTHHGARLIEAERLLSNFRLRMNEEEVAYLRACKSRQERLAQRERRYQHWIVGVSVVGVLIAIGFAAWALFQRDRAESAAAETESNLAKEFFRPLGRQSALNGEEVSALAELAALPDTQERVRIRFIEWALADAKNAQRLAGRAPVAMQAAVVLKRDRAERVAQILRARLVNQAESMQSRTAAALAIAELDLGDEESDQLAAGVLVESLNDSDQVLPKEVLIRSLASVTRSLPRDRAMVYIELAARCLTDALKNETNSSVWQAGDSREYLAGDLAKVCMSLPPDRKAVFLEPAAIALAHTLATEKSPSSHENLARGLVHLCRSMPSDAAFRILTPALEKERSRPGQEALARGLAEICGDLPTDAADAGAKVLSDALANNSLASSRSTLMRGLLIVCRPMPPGRAARYLKPAAELLVEDLKKPLASPDRETLANSLADVCRVLPLNDAARQLAGLLVIEKSLPMQDILAGRLAEVYKNMAPPAAVEQVIDVMNSSGSGAQGTLARSLAEVCKQIPPDKAAIHLDKEAIRLARALAREPSPFWARGLIEVCKSLPPARAANHLDPAAMRLANDLKKEKLPPLDRGNLAHTLAELCKTLPPDRAAGYLIPAIRSLSDAVTDKANYSNSAPLAIGIAELCKALPSGLSASNLYPVAGVLKDRLQHTDNSTNRKALAFALANLGRALPKNRRPEFLNPSIASLADAFAKEKYGPNQEALARGLVELCEVCPTDTAASVLVDALANFRNSVPGGRLPHVPLTHGLVEVCKSLPPNQAASQSVKAATILADALAMEKKDQLNRKALAGAFAEICRPLSPGQIVPSLLLNLAQYPECNGFLMPPLVEVSERSSLLDSIAILKHPLCYGEAQRVFLHRLEYFAGRRFKTRWEMTDWLRTNHPEINLSASDLSS
ncbi:MAG TPA: CHAT domain-containing protein [Gemmataceae bacterium]|nr:CHAT domain-containing protein [Gemmataceae bacterium]